MTKKLNEEQRVRKEYSQRGTRGQKMLNFRCDLENYEWLQQRPNKGRTINQALTEMRTKETGH